MHSLTDPTTSPLSATAVLSPTSSRSARTASPRSSTPSQPLSPQLADAPAHDLSHLLQPQNFQQLPPSTSASPPISPANSSPERILEAGEYHLAAIAAARHLTQRTSPTDYDTIFRLWYVRLCALVLLALPEVAGTEAKALGDFNNAAVYRNPLTSAHLASWSLRVLAMRLQGLGPAGDFRRTIMGYYELAREARDQNRTTKSADEGALWAARLRELGLLVADALVEMGDLEGAARHLATLQGGRQVPDAGLALREALVWLRVGNIGHARLCMELAGGGEDDDANPELNKTASMLSALIATADGDAVAAREAWNALKEKYPDDEVIAVNAAVMAVYTNDVTEVCAFGALLVRLFGARK